VEGRPNLLIFGASARAAAFSALRAGFQPWCADLFADADLRLRCTCFPVPSSDYPDRFLHILSHSDLPGPWMYTGGLENRPALVAAMARLCPLWGNGPDVLALARSPLLLSERLRRFGFAVPAVRIEPPAAPGRWLIKPRAGAGGAGIHFWQAHAGAAWPRGRVYFQEFVEGESHSAVYLGRERETLVLGVTRQLVGEEWLHAAPFHYCGSVGPVRLPPSAQEQLVRLRNPASGCAIRGVFGVDFILHEGVPWPVEVNPRYTASVEVLEYASGLRALAFHRAAFDPQAPRPSLPAPPRDVVGKAIYYAPAPLVFPEDGPWQRTLQLPAPVEHMPEFADIPIAGTPIKPGRPVLTFFARATNVLACLDALQQMARDLDRRLFGA
jgi:predicted ATP-grasp superfamily ATP-dependent carboligase